MLIEETVINEYGQPQQPFDPGIPSDRDQGDIEQAGFASDAGASGVEESPTDNDVVDDSDLSNPDDLDQV